MAIPYVVQRAREFNNDGDPLSKGRITFYEPGSVGTLKAVYTDVNETEEALNPHPLDAAGKVREGGVWLGRGRYKVVTEKFIGRDENGDKKYEVVDTMDDIPGSGSDIEGELQYIGLETVQDLREVDTDVYQLAYCANHSDTADNFGGFNDFGGGWFEWDPTNTSPDDHGGYIAPTGSPAEGRWVRLIEGSRIAPEMWGAFPNRDDLDVAGNINNMMNWASNRPNAGLRVEWRGATFYIGSDIILTGNKIDHTFNAGTMFRPSVSATGSNSVVVGGYNTIFDYGTELTSGFTGPGNAATYFVNALDKATPVSPELFGINGQGGTSGFTDPDVLQMLNNTKQEIIFGEGSFDLGHYIFNNATPVDWEDKRLTFRNGSFIECDNETWVVSNINREHNNFIFYGDYSNILLKNRRSPIQVSWYNITEREPGSTTGYQNIDNDKYVTMLSALTESFNLDTHLIWDSKILPDGFSTDFAGVVYFNSAPNITWENIKKVGHTIDGINIRVDYTTSDPTDNVNFGHVYSVKEAFLLTENSGAITPPDYEATFILTNRELQIGWFGRRPDADIDDNGNGGWAPVARAHNCAVASCEAWTERTLVEVVGDSAMVTVNNLDDGTGDYRLRRMQTAQIEAKYVVGWRNVNLMTANSCDSSTLETNLGVSAVFSYVGNLRLDRCKFYHNSTMNGNPGPARFLWGVDGAQVEVINTLMDCSENVDNQLIVVNNSFGDTITTPSCTFRGSEFVNALEFAQEIPIVTSPMHELTLTDNKFRGSGAFFFSIQNNYVHMVGNEFLAGNIAVPTLAATIQSIVTMECSGNTFKGGEYFIFSGMRQNVIDGNTFFNATLDVNDPINTSITGNNFRKSNLDNWGLTLTAVSASYVVYNTHITGNTWSVSPALSPAPRDTIQFAGTFATSGHDLVIKDNKASQGWNNISTENQVTYDFNATAEFGFTASSTLKGKTITIPDSSNFPSIFSGQARKLLNFSTEDVKVNGVYAPDATAPGDTFGITNVSGRTTSLEMKVQWFGFTTDSNNNDTYTQLITFTLGA